jgi:sorbitol-specific phosphotransferase system component IIBC
MRIDRLRSAKVAVPAGMSCVASGLLLIAISAALPHLSSRLAQPSQFADFVRGLAIGLGIAIEIAGLGIMLPAIMAMREQRRENSAE